MKSLLYIFCIIFLGLLILFWVSLLLPNYLVVQKEVPLLKNKLLTQKVLFNDSFTKLFAPYRVVLVEKALTESEMQAYLTQGTGVYILSLTQSEAHQATNALWKLTYLYSVSQQPLLGFIDKICFFYEQKLHPPTLSLSLLVQQIQAYMRGHESAEYGLRMLRDTVQKEVSVLFFKEQVRQQDVVSVLRSLMNQTNATLVRNGLDTFAYDRFYYRLYTPSGQLSQLEVVSIIEPPQEETLQKIGIVKRLTKTLVVSGSLSVKGPYRRILDSLTALYVAGKHLQKMLMYRCVLPFGYTGEEKERIEILGMGYYDAPRGLSKPLVIADSARR